MELNLNEMTERDLLILLNYQVGEVKEGMGDHGKRLVKLENEVLTFKTQVRTGWAIALSVGSILSFLIQHFLK